MRIKIVKEGRFCYEWYYFYGEKGYKEWVRSYYSYTFAWTAKLAAKSAIRKLHREKNYPIVVEEFEYEI